MSSFIIQYQSPLELEAQRFSKYLTADEISGAALCKARQKIKYTVFEELFEQTATSAPRDKRFHGYHLYAVDGMKGELPKTPELCAKYCESEKCRTPVFHAVSTFDVLNEMFIRSEFHFGTADERELAGKMIDAAAQDVHYKDEPQIWIFDRGFPSLSLIQKLLEHRLYFVMRVSSSFLKEVNALDKSALFQDTANFEPLYTAITAVSFAFYPFPLPSVSFLILTNSIPFEGNT